MRAVIPALLVCPAFLLKELLETILCIVFPGDKQSDINNPAAATRNFQERADNAPFPRKAGKCEPEQWEKPWGRGCPAGSALRFSGNGQTSRPSKPLTLGDSDRRMGFSCPSGSRGCLWGEIQKGSTVWLKKWWHRFPASHLPADRALGNSLCLCTGYFNLYAVVLVLLVLMIIHSGLWDSPLRYRSLASPTLPTPAGKAVPAQITATPAGTALGRDRRL